MTQQTATHKISKHRLDKRRLLLAELPERVEAKQQHVHNRKSMLAAAQAYNLKLERQRVRCHLTSFATPHPNPINATIHGRPGQTASHISNTKIAVTVDHNTHGTVGQTTHLRGGRK